MSRKKRKETDGKPKEDNLDGWDAKSQGGLMKGAKFAKPPCPDHHLGYHQYEKIEGTRNCRVWRCRLCDRTLGVNRKTGNVRERSAA